MSKTISKIRMQERWLSIILILAMITFSLYVYWEFTQVGGLE